MLDAEVYLRALGLVLSLMACDGGTRQVSADASVPSEGDAALDEDAGGPIDAEADASRPDAARDGPPADAALGPDEGPAPDGAPADGLPAPDAGQDDATSSDAGPNDAASSDAGPDAGVCGAITDLNEAGLLGQDGVWTFVGDSSAAPSSDSGACAGAGRELVFAFTPPERGRYVFTTVTDDPDLAGFDTVLYLRLDCADAGSELACNDDWSNLQSLIAVDLDADLPVYVFVDAFGDGGGGPFQLRVSRRTIAGEGEPCDPSDFLGPCAPGLSCLTIGDRSVCQLPVPPTLDGGALGFNPAVPAVGLRLAGRDPNQDVVAALLTLFDAQGAQIRLAFDEQPVRLPFTPQVDEDGAFTGEVMLPLPAGLPAAASAWVAVVDSGGLQSEFLELAAQPPARGDAGAACDAWRLFVVCEAGLLCDDDLCADAPHECPAAFDVRDLAEDAAVEADLADARELARGLCGGAGADRVYRLTARSAGPIVFQAFGADAAATPVLFARSRCGVEDAAVATGCAEPSGGYARLLLDLAAGETAYVFVDSADPAWTGPFRLTASRPGPPTLDQARVYSNPEASVLGFDLRGGDPDADLRAFSVRLLDVGGVDMLGGAAAAIDIGLARGEVTEPTPGALQVRAVRYIDLDLELRPIAFAVVGLVDAAGGRSATLTVAPEPTPVVARGAACDPRAGFAICGPDDHCGPDFAEGAITTCQEPQVDCPAEYLAVVDLSPELVQPDGSWLYLGDTRQGASNTSGTCGGDGSAEVVHRFLAPAAGQYDFRAIQPVGWDTLMYVRRWCGEETPDGELGCNYNWRGDGLGSLVVVALAAGELVYVFVDGSLNDGEYTLRVTRQGVP